MNKSIFLLIVAVLFYSCSDDDDVLDTDNIQEFVYLTETQFGANEGANNSEENAIELQAEMLTFGSRNEDVILTLEIIENGVEEGVDYQVISSSETITIPAGSLESEVGFRIITVDNGLQALGERSLTVRIASVSDASLNIGLGLDPVTNTETTITIADDECPDTIEKFDGTEWAFTGSNTTYYSDYAGTYITDINGDVMTITGDIANYDVGISVDATLVPDGPGTTSGTITFDPSTEGNDGTYDYRWILKQPGTYDICAGTMQLTTTIQYIDIYGPDPEAWIDWYDSEIFATISSLGGGGSDCFLSPFDGAAAEVNSSFTMFNSEYFYDDYENNYSDVGISVNNDCSVLTVSGDFLDLGELLSDIQIDFDVVQDSADENTGTLTIVPQVLGTDGGGFEYRVRSTGVPGTFDLSTNSINIELFVDYDNNGAGYINWYTSSSSFNLN